MPRLVLECGSAGGEKRRKIGQKVPNVPILEPERTRAPFISENRGTATDGSRRATLLLSAVQGQSLGKVAIYGDLFLPLYGVSEQDSSNTAQNHMEKETHVGCATVDLPQAVDMSYESAPMHRSVLHSRRLFGATCFRNAPSWGIKSCRVVSRIRKIWSRPCHLFTRATSSFTARTGWCKSEKGSSKNHRRVHPENRLI